MQITYHALVRFMERYLNFDFTELKMQFAIEHGRPSFRNIDDKQFIRWIERKIQLDDFRKELFNYVNYSLTDTEWNIINCNKNAQFVKEIGNHRVVILDDCIVTFI